MLFIDTCVLMINTLSLSIVFVKTEKMDQVEENVYVRSSLHLFFDVLRG